MIRPTKLGNYLVLRSVHRAPGYLATMTRQRPTLITPIQAHKPYILFDQITLATSMQRIFLAVAAGASEATSSSVTLAVCRAVLSARGIGNVHLLVLQPGCIHLLRSKTNHRAGLLSGMRQRMNRSIGEDTSTENKLRLRRFMGGIFTALPRPTVRHPMRAGGSTCCCKRAHINIARHACRG